MGRKRDGGHMKALEDESLLTKEVELVKVEHGGPTTQHLNHNLGIHIFFGG